MQATVSNVDVVFLLLLHHVEKIPPAGSLKLNLGPIGGYVQAVPCTGWKTTERENSSSVLLLLIHTWTIHVSFRLYRVALICGEIWHAQAGAGSLLKRFETCHNFSPFSNRFIRQFSLRLCAIFYLTYLAVQISPRCGAQPVLVCFHQRRPLFPAPLPSVLKLPMLLPSSLLLTAADQQAVHITAKFLS